MRRLEPREAEAYQGRNIDPHDDRSKRFFNRPFFNRRSAEEGSHRNLARAFWSFSVQGRNRAASSEYSIEGRYGGTFAARVATAIRTLRAWPHDPHPPAHR